MAELISDLLRPKFFATLQFAHVADAVRLEMLEFVTDVAKREAIVDIKSQFWMACKRLDVVGSKITAMAVAAFSTSKMVALKNSITPLAVFGASTIIQVSLLATVGKCVVITSSRSPLNRNGRNARLSFRRMLFPNSIAWAGERGSAHFRSALFGHFRTLTHAGVS
jgi:hypothetical protein